MAGGRKRLKRKAKDIVSSDEGSLSEQENQSPNPTGPRFTYRNSTPPKAKGKKPLRKKARQNDASEEDSDNHFIAGSDEESAYSESESEEASVVSDTDFSDQTNSGEDSESEELDSDLLASEDSGNENDNGESEWSDDGSSSSRKKRRRSDKSEVSEEKLQWGCYGCTFLNSVYVTKCKMCSAKRPVSVEVPPKAKRKPGHEHANKEELRKHRAKLAADKLAKSEHRKAFFAHHFDVFEPFLTKKVIKDYDLKNKDPAVKYTELAPLIRQPANIVGGEMRPYQLESTNWFRNLYHHGVGGILGDEMGLGKTLQSISILAYMKLQNIEGPHLVVCPLSVMSSWLKECKRWCPSLRVVRGRCLKSDLEKFFNEKVQHGTFDVFITTYEGALMMQSKLIHRAWNYMIVDEAHRLKNEETLLCKFLRSLKVNNCLLLTGTPIQNNLHELWALLNFLYPEFFPVSDVFDNAFQFDGNSTYCNHDIISKIHKFTKTIMLRRTKSLVEKSLPPKTEILLYVGMTSLQLACYKALLGREEEFMSNFKKKGGRDPFHKQLSFLLIQLLKVCNHPYLLPGVEREPFTIEEHVVENCQKLSILDKLLVKLKKEGHRVLLFSQFTTVLDIMEDYMTLRGFRYLRLDGSTHALRRDIDLGRFNAPNSPFFCFLISTRAGGLGLNLQTADTVIHYDSDWNPQSDLQAQARAHRIGQKKPVTIYRMVTEGTVEERIVLRAQKKLYLDAMISGRDEIEAKIAADDAMAEVAEKDLLSMVKFGAERIFNSSDLQGDDLDAVLEHARTVGRTDDSKDASEHVKALTSEVAKSIQTDCQNNASDYDTSVEMVSSRVFRGEHYKKEKKADAQSLIITEQRERAKTTITVDGFSVLKINDYDMDGSAAPSKSFLSTATDVYRKRAKRVLIHEEFCFSCKEGGDLVTCSLCPKSYHAGCTGGYYASGRSFSCPSHRCMLCPTHKSQYMFRCMNCPNAYCRDHCPPPHYGAPNTEGVEYFDHCPSDEARGFALPKVYFYICCSLDCLEQYDEDANFPDGDDTGPWDRISDLNKKELRSILASLPNHQPVTARNSNKSPSRGSKSPSSRQASKFAQFFNKSSAKSPSSPAKSSSSSAKSSSSSTKASSSSTKSSSSAVTPDFTPTKASSSKPKGRLVASEKKSISRCDTAVKKEKIVKCGKSQLSKLHGFSKNLRALPQNCDMVQKIHEILYEDSCTSTHVFRNIESWSGFELDLLLTLDDKQNELAKVFHRLVDEFICWRQTSFHHLASGILGVKVQMNSRGKYKVGARKGQPVPGTIRPVGLSDIQMRIAEKVALLLISPHEKRTLVRYNDIRK